MYTYKHFGGGLVAISATSFFNLCVDSVRGTVHSSERQRRTKGRAYLRTEALVEGSMPAHTALTTWCSQRATKHAHGKERRESRTPVEEYCSVSKLWAWLDRDTPPSTIDTVVFLGGPGAQQKHKWEAWRVVSTAS